MLSEVPWRGKYIISLLWKHKTGMLHGLCDAAAEYDRERRSMKKSYYQWWKGYMGSWPFCCCLDRTPCDK
ncbi:hypothetical protein Dsin_000845 [Dipteronia sinensis]|uniref:Uncharacterized protein n=1 Tax=Dipteronia sinensis TaxID=43782 RepID=A0AAE0B4F6_9ROSI|nr:hypothetical protein Dsin_000845 [Dipteronia sinensis]